MCGIAGAVAGEGTSLGGTLARAMAARLAHRGPDGEGILEWRAPIGAGGAPRDVVLVHRRLAVIDTSEAAREPLENEDGTLALVYNGEVYNHVALRGRLVAAGHRFRSRCDAEAVLHLYEDLGPACIRELRGMYAFAILDRVKGELFLARDAMGKKPLYVAELPGGGLAFASEVPALLEAGIPRTVDVAALDEFLALGYVTAPRTGLEQVRKLRPGEAVLYRGGRLLPVTDGRLPAAPRRAVSRRAIRETVVGAVRARLESDVPLGAFLSGGIDSTIVTGVLARLLKAAGAPPPETFSIGFAEASWDETSYARRAAERHRTVHHELRIGPETFDALPEIIFRHGEPFADESAIATFALARFARERVTVVLTGDGGDELFLGYRRARTAAMLEAVDRFLPRPVRAALGALAPSGGREHSSWRGAGRFFRAIGARAGERYLGLVGIFPERGARVSERMRELGPERFDLEVYLPDDILAKVDRMTMAHGLEARAPLLDRDVVDLARRLPAGRKSRVPWESKRALREAFHDLIPAGIARRGKMGLGVPVGPWLRGPRRALARDVLLSARARDRGIVDQALVARILDEHERGLEHGRKVVALLALEAWFRQVVDPPRPERSDW